MTLIFLSLCVFSIHAGNISELYELLGLSSRTEPSSAEIRRAYRKLSLKWHPDKNPGDEEAATKFREVQEAYDKLSDADARRIYEQYGQEEFHSKWQYERAKRMGKIKGGEADFYSDFELIDTLTSKTFYKKTNEGPWLLKFYAPWCVHCQNSIPHLKKGAILLEGIARVGAVNCEANRRVCNRLGIEQYPTIAYRNVDEDLMFEEFEGAHEPEQFYSFVKENQESGLVALDFFNFEDEVIQGEGVWLVTFTAGQWCPPCMAVRSVVRKTSFRLRDMVNCGSVNCDENEALCARQGIEYYPAFKIYPRGKGKSGIEIEYGGSHFPQFDLLNLISQIAPLMLPSKSYREKLTEFFQEHDEDRIEEIDDLLEDWIDKEDELFENLQERYVSDKTEL